MSVLVLGSLNMDLQVQAPRLPQAGETLLGTAFHTLPGGKGANQAVAIARQQVPTRLIGRVGADTFGQQLRAELAGAGVDLAGVVTDTTTHTGIASIAVSEQGENHIVVVPGANGRLDQRALSQLQHQLPQARLLLMQFEVPLPIVIQAAQLAHAAQVPVMLDPAPAQAIPTPDLYPQVHFLTPNQVEAAQLVGFPVATVEAASQAAQLLQQRGVATVLVKLGAQGVVCATTRGCFHLPAFAVTAVDTVAAGDAFNGGLAVALYEGYPLHQALRWASATAALSVTQAGAQPSLPTRSQVAAFLKTQPQLPIREMT